MIPISIADARKDANHSLGWMIHREGFDRDLMQCFVDPYKDWDPIPGLLKKAGGGIRLYNNCLQRLDAHLIDVYEAELYAHRGQPRFRIGNQEGLNYDIALRTGTATGEGIEIGECTTALEQLSLAEFPRLEEETDVPSKSGILLVHRHDPLMPGWVQGWLAGKWTVRKGEKLIRCDESPISLGSVQFRDQPLPKRQETGDTLDM